MLFNRDFYNEFVFKASRSSGAGGQHVNKVSTKVDLLFNINTSQLLTRDEKELLLDKAATKINNEGILRVHSQESRSQLKNKEIAVNKFYKILEHALTKSKKRIPKKLSKMSKLKRLESKKKQSLKKQHRSSNKINREDYT